MLGTWAGQGAYVDEPGGSGRRNRVNHRYMVMASFVIIASSILATSTTQVGHEMEFALRFERGGDWFDSSWPCQILIDRMGYGVIGNTADFDSAILGSNPSSPANKNNSGLV